MATQRSGIIASAQLPSQNFQSNIFQTQGDKNSYFLISVCNRFGLYSTSFAKVISFALHDKKFCSLARNKRGMSVGLARV